MRYKMTNTEFRDWLDAYLKVTYPDEHFLIHEGPWGASRLTIVERFEDGGEETIWQGPGEAGYHYQLSVMEGGFIFSFALTLVTPDIVDLKLLIYPSAEQPNWPREAANKHADALTAAIAKQWGVGETANPDGGPRADMVMRRGRLPISQDEKRRVVERWQQSQYSVTQDVFCAAEGISAATLRRWMSEL